MVWQEFNHSWRAERSQKLRHHFMNGQSVNLSGQEVRRVSESHGFQLVRQRGSHMVMQQEIEGGTLTVPVPDYAELRTGTLRSIICQSGLAVEAFHK
jgi:predicted RNA binding protein YcfA (HicA-like mRNA interferase family)